MRWLYYIRARVAETRAAKALSKHVRLKKRAEEFFRKAGL